MDLEQATPLTNPVEDRLMPNSPSLLTYIVGLNRLQESLLDPGGLQEKLQRVTDGIVAIFGADFARIWLIRPGDLCEQGCIHAQKTPSCSSHQPCLHLVSSSGRYTQVDGSHRRIPLGLHQIERGAAGADEHFLTNDVTHDPRIYDHTWAESLGLMAFAGYRLLSAGQTPMGVLAVFSQHPLSPEEDALLESLAISAAHLIQIAQTAEAGRQTEMFSHTRGNSMDDSLFVPDREQRYRAEKLLRAQRDLGLELNALHGLDETLATCLEAAIRLSGLDCGGIYLVDDVTGEVDLIHHRGLPPAFVAQASHYTADAPQVRLIMAGQPLYVSYPQVNVPKEQAKRREGLLALALLPIIYNQRAIASLHVASHVFETVPEFSRTVLETIAAQIGTAIARAKAETALQQSQENLQALFDSVEEFLFVLNTEGTMIQVNPAVCRRLGYSEAELVGNSILVVHPPAQREAAAAIVADMIAGSLDICIIPLQTKSGELIPVETRITRGQWNNQAALFGVSRDITERIKAEREIHRRTAQLEALRQIGLELTAQLDLKTLLQSMTFHATELLEAPRSGFFLYRPDLDVLEWVVATGFETSTIGSILHRGEGLSGKVWETGIPMMVDNYYQWDGRSTQYDPIEAHALIGVPVQWGGEILGVLSVSTNSPRTFSASDAELLGLLAMQAAIAIRNAGLLQAEREQRELAESLVKATSAITGALDPDLVLDRILEEAGRVVTGDACNLMLMESPGMVRMVRRREYTHSYADFANMAFSIAQYPALQQMFQTGEPLIIADAAVQTVWGAFPGLPWQRSYVGAPICIGSDVVGFLNVDSVRPGAFDATHAQRLHAFAGQSAIAIEHARLYRGLRTYTDMLEQRVSERTTELQTQYARLDAILNSTVDGIVVTDQEGAIIQANPIAERWLKSSLSLTDAAQLLQAIRDVVGRVKTMPGASGSPPEVLLTLKGMDLELRAAPVREPDAAETTAFVVDLHDISHLLTLDRMKSRFITDISHELRTPVTTLQLYVHLLQQRPDKMAVYLEKIVREVDRQAQLVQDIQEISHFDAGRVEIHPKPTPLAPLLEAVIEKYTTVAQKRGLLLMHRPANASPTALVDPQRLEQALDNLLINAMHYTPHDGAIRVDTEVVTANGRDWATITVTDTGIGIPAEELPHIFERFFRGKESQLMHPGTGLGLSIVNEIVELHGGYVTVQSPSQAATQGHPGTTFTLWLPLAT